MNILKEVKITIILAAIFIGLGFVSCTKKADETSNNKVIGEETIAVGKEDFTEKDEDLLTVDYKEFYDALAPHGEWIEVKGNDIGVDLKKESASLNGSRTISISDLFGVNTAYADNAEFGSFYVWKPAPALSITTSSVEPVDYQPYTNGQWVYTDAGWYFKAATPPEEITSHYGRWVNSPSIGYVWMPGRVWAPSWVDWRENDTYVAWTPTSPASYIVNNVILGQPVVEENYVVVEKRYFVEPTVYKYMYKENKNKIMIKEWRSLDGVMVMNKTVINKGPDYTVIQTVSGNPFEMVKLNHVGLMSEVKYSPTQYYVYSPVFTRVKIKENNIKSVFYPKNFMTFDNALVKHEKNKNDKESGYKENDNNKGKDQKWETDKNEGKGNKKYIDDGNMKNGDKNKDNGKNKEEWKNKDDGKNKDGGNKDKGKDNGNKDKGGKDKGNDNKKK